METDKQQSAEITTSQNDSTLPLEGGGCDEKQQSVVSERTSLSSEGARQACLAEETDVKLERQRRGSDILFTNPRARRLASIHKDIDRTVDLEIEMAIDDLEAPRSPQPP